MQIALVAMPWATFDMPSPAIGALASVVRHKAPHWQVDCFYAYLDVWAALRDVYEPIASDERAGELLYATLLYPGRARSSRRAFEQWAEREATWPSRETAGDVFERIVDACGRHADSFARELGGRYDVVGFTTSYAQLFASLAVAQRLKAVDPAVRVVLGGMGVPYHIGPSVLRTYPFVDYVVQGEGERRLMHLLRALESSTDASDLSIDGIVGRHDITGTSRQADSRYLHNLRDEIDDLNALPVPDFTEYTTRARELGIRWIVPIEASRGCWWDRVKRTGDPSHTCYFCSLNTSSYRHKKAERVAAEMRVLCERHENLRFFFLDNIIRHRGVESLTAAIQALGKDLSFAYELRAQIHPREILALKEAGCDAVQIGIEGLSTRYLERIGKGTSTIQNLQAMKTCYELGVRSGSNLLVGFPGATAAEVEETAETIRRFACVYQPTVIVEFSLYVNNLVFHQPDRFRVGNIRNADELAAALPAAVYDKLALYWLDYDALDEQPDWAAVREAVADWRALHERLTLEDGTAWFLGLKPLIYRDGGTFIEIVDRRRGLDLVTFAEPWRSIVLFCAEIRGRAAVMERFGGVLDASEIERGLAALVRAGFVYEERGRYLSLPVAARPEDAARRIRASD